MGSRHLSWHAPLPSPSLPFLSRVGVRARTRGTRAEALETLQRPRRAVPCLSAAAGLPGCKSNFQLPGVTRPLSRNQIRASASSWRAELRVSMNAYSPFLPFKPK